MGGQTLTVYLAITDECISCLVTLSWPHGSYVCAVSDTPWQSHWVMTVVHAQMGQTKILRVCSGITFCSAESSEYRG